MTLSKLRVQGSMICMLEGPDSAAVMNAVCAAAQVSCIARSKSTDKALIPQTVGEAYAVFKDCARAYKDVVGAPDRCAQRFRSSCFGTLNHGSLLTHRL